MCCSARCGGHALAHSKDRQPRFAPRLIGRGLPARRTQIRLAVQVRPGPAHAMKWTMRRVRGRLPSRSVCRLGGRGGLRAVHREQGDRNRDERGAAHEGECGQSRASPVYVDPHSHPSAFADSGLSDNWTRSACFRVRRGEWPYSGMKTAALALGLRLPLNSRELARGLCRRRLEQPASPEALIENPFGSMQILPPAILPAAIDSPALKTAPYRLRRSSPPCGAP